MMIVLRCRFWSRCDYFMLLFELWAGYLRAPVGRPWWCGLEGRDRVPPRSPGHSPDTCHKLGQGLKSEQDLPLDSLMKEKKTQTSILKKSYINIRSCMVQEILSIH